MPKYIYIIVSFIVGTASFVFAKEPISDKELNNLVAEFSYTAEYDLVSYTLDSGKNRRCLKEKLKLKTSYPGNPDGPVDIDAIVYRPNPRSFGMQKLPVVIQLPPMGGTNFFDRRMGKDLCKKQVTSVIIENDYTNIGPNIPLPVPEEQEEALRRTASAIKATMAFIKDHETMNEKKIGLFGVSLGGILGSFAFGLIDEISAGYFLVSGSDIPFILAHSDQRQIVDVRKRRMKEQNFKTIAEYEDFLRKYITMDNFDTARRVPKEATLLRMSKKDTSVPTSQQFQLFEAFGRPKYTTTDSGHTGTVVGTLLWANRRRSIVNFYLKRFALDNPRQPERAPGLDE